MSILAGPRQACCCVPKGPEAARTGTGSAGSALIQSPKCTGCTGSSSPNPTALNPQHLSDGKTSVPTNPRLSSTSCPNLHSGWQLGAGTVLTWRTLVCPHPSPVLQPVSGGWGTLPLLTGVASTPAGGRSHLSCQRRGASFSVAPQ